jgi:hypothetical protein
MSLDEFTLELSLQTPTPISPRIFQTIIYILILKYHTLYILIYLD